MFPFLLKKEYFNPRSREGSDPLRATMKDIYQIFQSTLPRGERLCDSASTSEQVHRISIHAPARGATKIFIREWYKYSISIHAPARGATRHIHRLPSYMVFQSTLPRGERLKISLFITAIIIFQSTLPRGERHSWTISAIIANTISIHAPARGAT